MPAKKEEQPLWSQEELDEAEAELSGITPEELLDMKQYIHALEEQMTLPEAGGMVSIRLYNTSGAYAYFESRSANIEMAAISILRSIQWWKEHVHGDWSTELSRPPLASPEAPTMSATVTAPITPAPVAPVAPPPAQTGMAMGESVVDSMTLQVATLKHETTTTGKHYLRVIPSNVPSLSRYGVTAWPEVLPPQVLAALDKWELGKPYPPPEGMTCAEAVQDGFTQSGNPRYKIVSFHD